VSEVRGVHLYHSSSQGVEQPATASPYSWKHWHF